MRGAGARTNGMTDVTTLIADDLTQLSFALYENKGVFALLLGSGLSRAAEIPTGSVTWLRDPSNRHGAGAFRLSIRSVASLLEVGKLSAIEVKHEKPKGG